MTVHPGKARADQVLVQTAAIVIDHADDPAVAVDVLFLHANLLFEDLPGGKLFGLGAEVLAALGAIDAGQADLILPAVLQQGDGVAVGDADDPAGEVSGGEGRREKESEDEGEDEEESVSVHGGPLRCERWSGRSAGEATHSPERFHRVTPTTYLHT